MQQISNLIFCDDDIAEMPLESRLMPNPYNDYPYLFIENFLPEATCCALAKMIREDSDAEEAKIKTTLLQSVVNPTVDTSIRKTAIYKLDEQQELLYNEAFAAHQGSIERFFSLALTTATTVQVLEYTEGSFYIRHADDSSELVNDEGETVGFIQIAPQRKLTTVLFCTSHEIHQNSGVHFSGGELRFNYLCNAEGSPVTLRPKAGDMIIFPSNPIYSHEVLPVTSGYRLTMVQWHNAITG